MELYDMNNSKFFSIVCHKYTDILNKEQLLREEPLRELAKI